jgi:hypothetical protein
MGCIADLIMTKLFRFLAALVALSIVTASWAQIWSVTIQADAHHRAVRCGHQYP